MAFSGEPKIIIELPALFHYFRDWHMVIVLALNLATDSRHFIAVPCERRPLILASKRFVSRKILSHSSSARSSQDLVLWGDRRNDVLWAAMLRKFNLDRCACRLLGLDEHETMCMRNDHLCHLKSQLGSVQARRLELGRSGRSTIAI